MPPTSPQEWLTYLEPKLDDQIDDISEPGQYFDGNQRLSFATQKFREAFARYYAPLANNWMRIIVEAPVSRMEIQGFRFDPDTSKNTWELDADSDAWKMWQANNFDSVSRMVHIDACKLGISYVLVAPPASDTFTKPPAPIMTGEHASQCYVQLDPANHNHRLAALKRWADDWDNHAYATVWTPDAVVQFRSERTLSGAGNGDTSDIVIFGAQGEPIQSSNSQLQWQQIGSEPNEIGVVPMVPIVNNPDLMNGGSSDLTAAIPIQDAINKYCLDMQVSSEFHAYPQRWATGWEKAVDNTGHELTDREVEIKLATTRIIRATSHETTFGSFAQGDVNNYLQPIDTYVDHLAAQTQTPVYYLKGRLANLSADAMHAADQGLVDRVKGKMLSYSDGWEEFMRTAFLAVNDQARGHANSAEVIWADPESKSLAVVVQAAVQMRQNLNVPIEMAWEMLGWSPQKIRQARDLMGLPPGGPAGAAAPPAPPAPPVPALLGPSGQPVSTATTATQQNNATPPSSAIAPLAPPPASTARSIF